jgi:hypothetical protein
MMASFTQSKQVAFIVRMTTIQDSYNVIGNAIVVTIRAIRKNAFDLAHLTHWFPCLLQMANTFPQRSAVKLVVLLILVRFPLNWVLKPTI